MSSPSPSSPTERKRASTLTLKTTSNGSVDHRRRSSSASIKSSPLAQTVTVAPNKSNDILEAKSSEELNPDLPRTPIPKEIKIKTPRASIDSLSLRPAPILAVNTSRRVSTNIDTKGKSPLPVEVQDTRPSVATAFGTNSESSTSLRETALNSRSSSFKDAPLSCQSNSSENVQDSDEILNIRISSSNLSGLADRLKLNSATINVFDSKSPEILNVFNDSASPNTSAKPKAIRTLADVPNSMFTPATDPKPDSLISPENSLKIPLENKRGSILSRSDSMKKDSRRKSVAFTEPPPESATTSSPMISPPLSLPDHISPTDSAKSSSSGPSSSEKGSETSKSSSEAKSFYSSSSIYSNISSSVNTKVDDEDDEVLGKKYEDDQVLGKRYSRKIDSDNTKKLKKKRDKSDLHKKKHQSYIPPGFQVQKPKRPKEEESEKPRKPKLIETENGDLASIDKDLIEKRIQKRQSKKLVTVPESPIKTTVIPPTIVKETNYKTQAIFKGAFLGISLLYSLSFFSTYKNVVQAQQSFFDVDYKINDTLMLSSSTFALLQVGIYWGYYFFIQKDVFIGIGFNLPVLMMFFDVAVSDVEITKITSVFPPVFMILYEFGVWFNKYVVGWDWPMPIYGQYFTIDSNPAMIIAFVFVSCLFVIVGVNIVYFYLLLKKYINSRVKKTNPV
ncbi:hypothetical protein HDV06_005262 [Boothiomyces sp. JEL0866]|nr:hypothetical protein HDV06_005262 [Boothiomyces sp. JEL0866]